MTEQVKMASHEEVIEKGIAKRSVNWSFLILGIIVILIGYIFYDFHINHYVVTQTGRKIFLSSEYPYQFIGLFLVIVGIVIILIGIVKKLYSRV